MSRDQIGSNKGNFPLLQQSFSPNPSLEFISGRLQMVAISGRCPEVEGYSVWPDAASWHLIPGLSISAIWEAGKDLPPSSHASLDRTTK